MFPRWARPSSTRTCVTRSAILRFCSGERPATQVICTCGMGPSSGLAGAALGGHGGEHFAHAFDAARSAALAPLLVTARRFFQIPQHLRVLELLAPGAQHRLDAHPDHVLLARGFEEKLLVEQAVAEQGRNHL